VDPPINTVLFAPDLVDKLWFEHGLTQADVEAAIFAPETEPRWDVDNEHGGRVVLRGYVPRPEPNVAYISLALDDPVAGVWTCITAFIPDDEDYGVEEE
jgi:hypothetical protein